jgi:hypothetical protein
VAAATATSIGAPRTVARWAAPSQWCGRGGCWPNTPAGGTLSMPASGTVRNSRTVRGHEGNAVVVEATVVAYRGIASPSHSLARVPRLAVVPRSSAHSSDLDARSRTVAIRRHRREDDTVAEKPERWDTWTRSELLAIRGYPLGSENSPAPAGLHMGGSAVQVDDSPEASNGSEISQGAPVALAV